jgi:magnesium chelatase family protein
VLFLDELPEYRRSVLESLRQPIENGNVTISRSSGSFTFPSRFMLVAAMNPCPCGYYGAPGKRCRCSQLSVQSYRSRISGPMLDRIDLHVEVPPLPETVLTARRNGVTSAQLRQQVMAARQRQMRRYAGTGIQDNAGVYGTWLDKFCSLPPDAAAFLRQALQAKNLSARSYDRILRVARTIADLENSEEITPAHLAEACQYRCLDQAGEMMRFP